jgi:subtilisin family serine protease
VIAVGSTDPNGAPSDFSNGGTGIDLAAPGASIVTAAPPFLCSSGYGTADGTSFAAPAAAGAAALVLAEHPGLQVGQLDEILSLHGMPSSSLWSESTGFGLLDVAAALAAPVPPPDAPEVDDTIVWAKKHPPVLTPSKRRRVITAQVTTEKDPADVFRVSLRKGDLFSASLKGRYVALSLSDGKRKLGRGPIKRSGIYYVTVTARSTPPAGSGYTLTLRR